MAKGIKYWIVTILYMQIPLLVPFSPSFYTRRSLLSSLVQESGFIWSWGIYRLGKLISFPSRRSAGRKESAILWTSLSAFSNTHIRASLLL